LQSIVLDRAKMRKNRLIPCNFQWNVAHSAIGTLRV
jgi:hypothetical protein